MHARAIDDARARLRELRREEWQDLALAGTAFVLAVAATRGAPSLALPLLVGGMSLGVLGMRALWRRWDLVDRLAGEPDAYSIAEVLAYASREATMERRQTFAALIRQHLEPTPEGGVNRLEDATEDLAALADELDAESLLLSPACAVACWRLVSDPTQSPLLGHGPGRAPLRSTVGQIRAGFTSRTDCA
jgi:hypothetical protein